MPTDISSRELFRLYWPSYLPLWLSPLLMVLAGLLGDFCTSSAWVVTALLVSALYFFGSFVWASLRYMEGSVTWRQAMLLSSPFLGVGIAAMVISILVCSLLGRPL